MAATKPRTAVDEVGIKGEFKRTDAGFRNKIEPGGRFEPEGQFRRVGAHNHDLCPGLGSLNLQLTWKLHASVHLSAGRYHLYVSLACPWACRCLAVLKMKVG